MKIYYIIADDNKEYYVLATNHEQAMKIFKKKKNKDINLSKVYLQKIIVDDCYE